MWDALQANWGETPARSVVQPCTAPNALTHLELVEHVNGWEHKTGWCRLLPDQKAYVESCFAGRTLPQMLEAISFVFKVDGVCRAETHQMVRTRIGAAYMQHGGRDNDWRHRGWSMPETMARACDAYDMRAVDPGTEPEFPKFIHGREVCIENWQPIKQYLESAPWLAQDASLHDAIEDYLDNGKRLYSALVDAGIPWQDARRVLWMGTQTYIHAVYNFASFRGVLGNRLEHIMDWEVNCVAQLMQREINMKCPPMFAKYLGSHSDHAKMAKFDGLESWPPDGKWPSRHTTCKICHHAEGNHIPDTKERTVMVGVIKTPPTGTIVCEVCERSNENRHIRNHTFVPVDTLPRQHRRNQMPFFVLHPSSMKGGPVQWLWTNGHYDDVRRQLSIEQEEAIGSTR